MPQSHIVYRGSKKFLSMSQRYQSIISISTLWPLLPKFAVDCNFALDSTDSLVLIFCCQFYLQLHRSLKNVEMCCIISKSSLENFSSSGCNLIFFTKYIYIYIYTKYIYNLLSICSKRYRNTHDKNP